MASESAQRLVARLAQLQRRIVFAESCTGGLISAELAKVPGVSEWLCGSAVTYRCETKISWLGVSRRDIDERTAVCHQVAEQMARGVLIKTPEADFSASITGHLGPGAPEGFDGVVFVGFAARGELDSDPTNDVERYQLERCERESRQEEAAAKVIDMVLAKLS